MARVGGRPRASVSGGTEEGSDLYVRALARGLSILALFDVEHPEWSLPDVCLQTGLSKTTAYRLLRTLEWKGFVTSDSAAERYHLGPATIPVAYLSLSNVGFVRSTRLFIEELAAVTGETVELAVEGEGGAVVVDQVATRHPFKPNLPHGRVLRNLANSAMKVLAAYRSEEDRERLLRGRHLKLTPNTKTDPDEIRRELIQVAERGLAYDLEEQDQGVCAVSAPIFGLHGDVRAAITVVAPAERFGPCAKEQLTEAVKKSAAAVADHLSRSSAAGGMLTDNGNRGKMEFSTVVE